MEDIRCHRVNCAIEAVDIRQAKLIDVNNSDKLGPVLPVGAEIKALSVIKYPCKCMYMERQLS